MLHAKHASRLFLGTIAVGFVGGCGVTVAPPIVGFTSPRIVYHRPVIYTPPVYYAPQTVVVARTVVEPLPEPEVAVAKPANTTPAVDTQLNQLVAPIALYPDPLLAQLLPATTYPEQVQAASEWLRANPNPPDDLVETQLWSPNVKALVRYPAALKVLNNDAAWMQSLGSAFNSEPAAVMAAIQEMRAQAQTAGNLVAVEQIKVIVDAGVISIQPVEITAPLFVPVYDPVAVYASPVAIAWGQPYVVGPWLGYGVDWYGGAVFAGPWYGGWYHDGYWGRDYGWHYDHYRAGWRHEDRFGRAPHVDRMHYATARALHNREADIKRVTTKQHAVDGNRTRTPARESALVATRERKETKTTKPNSSARQVAEHPATRQPADRQKPEQASAAPKPASAPPHGGSQAASAPKASAKK